MLDAQSSIIILLFNSSENYLDQMLKLPLLKGSPRSLIDLIGTS